MSKTYTYDAFGVEIGKDASDTNPFRYCGEYYDNELDKIYLRARYYTPVQGRFMTEDPIRDGVNWYAYCAGDPVNFVDPWGLKIYVADEQQNYIDYLNVLSRDELAIDENGYVYIKSWNSNADDRPVGTELIYQLIESEHTCTLERSTETEHNQNLTRRENDELASIPGIGCNATVYINFTKKSKCITSMGVEEIPTQISLGHELIHALRTMKGNRKSVGMGINMMENCNDEYWRQEEFDTVGINHIRDDGSYANAFEWYFTENSLRREQGLPIRINYIL